MRRAIVSAALAAAVLAAVPVLAAQDVRQRIQSLQLPPLRFNPPLPKRVTLSNGVPVYLLEDHTLELLSVQIVGKRGVAHVPDSLWGVAWQADGLLRTGGTTRLSPDSPCAPTPSWWRCSRSRRRISYTPSVQAHHPLPGRPLQRSR